MVEVVPAAKLESTQPVNLNFMVEMADIEQPFTRVEPALKELRAALAEFWN